MLQIAEHGSLVLQIVHFPFSMPVVYQLPPTALHMPCADETRLRMLNLNAGKDRQVMKCIQLQLCMSGVHQY